MNAGTRTATGESNAVKHDPASCTRESLFGIDYIKSAYRDKKEAHKSSRKKRPSRLKQHAQLHQVPQETCTDRQTSDLTGDYSPMDCSPYQAAAEQVSRETSVGCDPSIHILDSSVSNQQTSYAEDDLVSATEHLVIEAELPTCQDEGRDPTVDASESNFGSNFSSFDEEINFCDVSQPLFTNMSVDPTGEPKMYTTEAWVDGFECNISGQTCEENSSRTPHEFCEPVNTQSSSADLSGLNFTFGASLYPGSSSSAQKRTSKRKLRTKGSQVLKSSSTQASVQPKSPQDTKMQFSPETSETKNSVKEQFSRDASILAGLETCETWRTRFVWTRFYFVFISHIII
jgi:DnaJ family protein C protein 7